MHAHGRRWREVLEVTEAAHGLGGGRGAGVGYGLPASIGAALGYKAAVASVSAWWATATS